MKSKWWLEPRAQHADARPLTTICYSRELQEPRRDCIYEQNKDPLAKNI